VVAGNSVHIAPRYLNGQVMALHFTYFSGTLLSFALIVMYPIFQTVAAKDQPRIAEPIKELDIMLTQVQLFYPFP
jgi:DNA polymerase delta subunit 2